MMAYIDSEMQRRRGIAGATQGDGAGNTPGGLDQQGENTSRSAYWTPVVPEGRGATLGKLHEVDLGEETKKRNIARTQEATRRLADDGSAVEVEEEEEVVEGKKKMKGRRRRNSQDIQRDKLVEEVLKESRCNAPPTVFLIRLDYCDHHGTNTLPYDRVTQPHLR